MHLKVLEKFPLTHYPKQLGFSTVPAEKPNPINSDARSTESAMETAETQAADEKVLRDLHTLLLETEVREGKLVCGNCGHEYKVKEGIANFLLPSHLGEWVLHWLLLLGW